MAGNAPAPASDRELVLTRLIDAPRHKLYRAWTEPALLKQWFAPLPFTTPVVELDGADAFRLTAYRRAAQRIRESAVPVAQLALEGTATRLSGIGGTIEAKIVEITQTGDLEALAKLRGRIPPGLVDVMHVPGLGPKTARRVWEDLGVTTVEETRGRE